MRIGFILRQYVPTKVAAKRKQLIQNRHGFTDCALKFTGEINNKVAAPSNPTPAGLNP